MEELIFIVRGLLNDLDATSYTDEKLLNIICVAAFFVISETDYNTSYIVNVKDKEIEPDPSYITAADVPFMTLVSLKAAIIVVKGECKKYSLLTGRVHDGPSIIDTSSLYKAMADLLDKLQDEYEKVKMNIEISYLSGYGYTITTPTVVETIWGTSLS
jgi:hypothetical protein